MRKQIVLLISFAALVSTGLFSACTSQETAVEDPGTLVVYSGRNENLVGPLIERFEAQSGIDVRVRYGDTAELAAAILEEGANSPADVFYAQDAGALGALAQAGMAASLPEDILSLVEPRFRSPEGLWVGVSGRARVVAYNVERVSPEELPASILGFTDPEWAGRIGWAPTNGSFQAFVTALRVVEGEDAARAWLEGIQANDPVVFPNNLTVLEGVADGTVDVGFINHYYLFRKLAEDEAYPVALYFPTGGDAGALVNVAGVAKLASSTQPDNAEAFIRFLLSEEAQTYFRDQTFEYPLAAGVEADPRLPPLSSIETPDIDLSDLEDLEGTLRLLQEAGVLE
ncbi:MAG TPA: iron ABC transporter substrate-binding protein [Chloroflexi bacterium]|nr:iron ABC transporter substrate-binding protein [Chloroflexota bacterium]